VHIHICVHTYFTHISCKKYPHTNKVSHTTTQACKLSLSLSLSLSLPKARKLTHTYTWKAQVTHSHICFSFVTYTPLSSRMTSKPWKCAGLQHWRWHCGIPHTSGQRRVSESCSCMHVCTYVFVCGIAHIRASEGFRVLLMYAYMYVCMWCTTHVRAPHSACFWLPTQYICASRSLFYVCVFV
jgi:hypothetical protein